MATLTLNDKAYDIDKLSNEARAQVESLRFVEVELARLSATLAVFQTARIGYINALMPYLEGTPEQKSPLQ